LAELFHGILIFKLRVYTPCYTDTQPRHLFVQRKEWDHKLENKAQKMPISPTLSNIRMNSPLFTVDKKPV